MAKASGKRGGDLAMTTPAAIGDGAESVAGASLPDKGKSKHADPAGNPVGVSGAETPMKAAYAIGDGAESAVLSLSDENAPEG